MNAITIAGTFGRHPARGTDQFRLSRQLLAWWQRAQQRRQLAEMEDWQLRDLGISREMADAEAARAFWD
jgi:uncharacterized protein YjiS (DUF1127 family)